MYKMSLVVLASLSMLVVMASSQPLEKTYYDVSSASSALSLFEDYVKNHNKVYKDDADREVHYQAFVTNMKKVNKMNENPSGATYGMNKFSDYTADEMKQMRGFKKT